MSDPIVPDKGMQILVVDGDEKSLKILEVSLKGFGQVDTAESGNQAIALLGSGQYDIVFTDYTMEDGNGIDILVFMKERGIHIPIIFGSYFNTIQVLSELLNYQVFGILDKPFTTEQVVLMAERAVEKVLLDRTREKLMRVGLTAAELLREMDGPMTLMDMGTKMLEEEKGETPATAKIKKGMARLVSIVEKTKNKMRGDAKNNFWQFVLGEAIQQAEEEFSSKASKGGVAVSVSGSVAVKIFGDIDDIRRILVNLVDNGIDAVSGLNEKWIKIIVKAGEKGVLISVIDSGTGIPGVVKRKLFTTLFTTKGKAGNGFGLGLSRQIAHEHGGNLYLISDAVNTTFALLLPPVSKNEVNV